MLNKCGETGGPGGRGLNLDSYVRTEYRSVDRHQGYPVMPREPPLVPEEREHSHRHPTDHIYRAACCMSPAGPGRQEQRRSEVRGQRKLVLCLGPDPRLRLLSLPRKSGTQGAEGSPEPMTRWQEARRGTWGTTPPS